MRHNMLGRLNEKENCEIHVFRNIKTATGQPARKKVCHKRKTTVEGLRAWKENLKAHACKSPKVPKNLREWCGKSKAKAKTKAKSPRKSAKRAQLALPGMR